LKMSLLTAGGLGWMTFTGPCQPKAFYDSVILCTETQGCAETQTCKLKSGGILGAVDYSQGQQSGCQTTSLKNSNGLCSPAPSGAACLSSYGRVVFGSQ